jgi:phosphoribosylanthranilate isomerase
MPSSTKIKLCGIMRPQDIDVINRIKPEYIGFVFAPASRRYITDETAAALKKWLAPGIKAVGVFVDEAPERISGLLDDGIIDIAQLHGHEDEEYLCKLKTLTDKPLIKAFRIKSADDLLKTWDCTADHILLDAGAGGGTVFDWELLRGYDRPYFLAGGLNTSNAEEAVRLLHPFAVDVSSGIETDGLKDPVKMESFVKSVRAVSFS